MSSGFRFAVLRRISTLSALACLTVWWSAPAVAADVRESSSLKVVPADVEFYSSSLLLREQFDALVKSKAFAAIRDMPILQMGLGLVRIQWENPQNDQLKAVKAALEQPENKQLAAMLADAVSHEIFFCGSDGFGPLLQLANDLNAANRLAQLEAATNPGENREQLLARRIIESLTKRLEGLRIPDSIIGFKLSDPKSATDQLARLEQILPAVVAMLPQGQERYSRQTIGAGNFMTVRLDGSLVPWEQILEKAEGQRAQLEQLTAKIKPMTLTISIGLWNDYLIVATGDTSDHLKKLGTGQTLGTRKELAPLAQYGDRKIAAIAYVSEPFMRQLSSAERQIDDLVNLAEQVLPMAKLDAPLEQELRKDVKALASTIKQHIPKPGAVAGFTFLTDSGYEGYSYNWGEQPSMDASQKLTILQHVGGNPIFFAAGRSKYSPQCYDGMRQYCGRVMYYVEKIGLPRMSQDQQQLYEKVKTEMQPLVARVDKVTREMLMPAVKDGQTAIVLETIAKSTQWHAAMPAAKQPLPMLEIAMVSGVSDAGLLKKAASEYFGILQEMANKLHAIQPEAIPEMKLPAPQINELPQGTVASYPMPPQAGVDAQISPAAGVAKDALVLSMMPAQVGRLLATAAPKPDVPMADLDRPAGLVIYMNFAGLIQAITPWVDYGMTAAAESGANAAALETVKGPVQTVLKVLQCFRGGTAVTYQQDGVWVTHSTSLFQDLP